MRVLILSCNTGGGHNACAGAIQEAFSAQGDICDIADSLCFVSDRLSKFMSWGHTTMYRHIPGLFRVGYGFVEKHPAILQEDAAVYKLLTGGTEQLYRYIQQGQYDPFYILGGIWGLLLLHILFIGVCAWHVNTGKEYEKTENQTPFRRSDVYLDVLKAFSAQAIKGTKTEMIGTAVRRLIEINTEKEDAQWRQDM